VAAPPTAPGSAELALIATEFDRAYYLHAYLDVTRSGADPVRHFATHGWREKRRPAAWFDTDYYLASNPDVAAEGINPFWHYLDQGRAAGRAPAPPGGHRRRIIERLVSPEERRRGHPRAEEVTLLDGAALAARLRTACAAAKGLVVSVSHDDYTQVTGGVQLCIGDEARAFQARGLAYLHVSPVDPELTLAGPEARGFLHLVLDGEALGESDHATLEAALKGVPRTKRGVRLFVVHSLFGHDAERAATWPRLFGARESFFWLHDYASVCAGYNLLRDDVAFCGLPAPASNACMVCVYGDSRVDYLRRIHRFFEAVPFTVVAPSAAALAVWRAGPALPHGRAVVHPHCRLELAKGRKRASVKSPAGTAADPVRVGFIGPPVPHKGWDVFARLVDEVGRRDCYRFHHFIAAKVPPRETEWVTQVPVRVTADDRDAMVAALAEHAIDLVLVLSPWPETFSYVTYEAFAAGADVIALADGGNVAAAVRESGRGLVFADAEALLAAFAGEAIVAHVAHRPAGPRGGRLVHDGTTATIPGVLA